MTYIHSSVTSKGMQVSAWWSIKEAGYITFFDDYKING